MKDKIEIFVDSNSIKVRKVGVKGRLVFKSKKDKSLERRAKFQKKIDIEENI